MEDVYEGIVCVLKNLGLYSEDGDLYFVPVSRYFFKPAIETVGEKEHVMLTVYSISEERMIDGIEIDDIDNIETSIMSLLRRVLFQELDNYLYYSDKIAESSRSCKTLEKSILKILSILDNTDAISDYGNG